MEKIPVRFAGDGVVSISFESNLRDWTAGLSEFKRTQLPFATAKALTDVARYDVKPAIERQIEMVFDRPTPFTRRGVGYRPAYKNAPVARVFIKDVQAGYLTWQETGGVRTPKRRAIVVPVRQRVNQYGNLPRGSVQRLLARKDTFSGRVNGQGGIWQRTRKGGLKLLVAYEDRAEYRPIFNFHKVAREAAELHFPRRFGAALARAIATAH